MSRSTKKGPYVNPKLAKKVENAIRSNSREVIRTCARASVIMPDMLGLTIAVHDGRRHVPVFVTENMVSEGVIVIDVGINRVDGKLTGDINF